MSTQRFSSVAHWGAFTAVVEDGRFVRAEPFERDPAPSAMLDAMPAMVYSDKRVMRPAVRREWLEKRTRERSGAHNEFVEVDWGTALDLAAGEIRRVREQHGPQGLFGGSYGWSSAGRVNHAKTLVRRFLFSGGGCVDQIGTYSFGAGQTLLPHIIGTADPIGGKVTSWASIVKHCKVFVAFGGLALRNAQITSGGGGEHSLPVWLQRCKEAGIRFINIGPNRNDCPDWLEAQWIPLRPGTDTALMLAVAHELVTSGRHQPEYLARYTHGYGQLEAYVLGASDGIAKTPEWASPICGVPAADIRALADTLAGTCSMLSIAWSLQRAHRGEQPYWMCVTLAAMLGQIGVPGGGVAFGHGSSNGVGIPRPEVGAPEMAPGHNPGAAHNIPVARMADMLLAPGEQYHFNGKLCTYPDVRLVCWAGGNPYHHHQDLNRLNRAWNKPETVIVNESWWTPTARRADIVFPVTTTLERNDIGASSRDRFVFAMQRAIAPVGEARDDYAIFRALAARLGHEEAFTEGRDQAQWLRHVYDRYASIAASRGYPQPDFDAWWAHGYSELPEPEKDFVLFESFYADPQANPLKTPSGKIEIGSDKIAAMGYADCPGHPVWLAPDEWLGSAGAEYPLHLMTIQPPDKLHSQGAFAPSVQQYKVNGREAVRLNPRDAKARGIANGDPVRLYNRRGACLGGALLDEAVLEGVAVMATGAWYAPDADGLDVNGNPNVLAADRGTSSLTQGCAALSVLVQIEPVAA
ncbi:MAG: Asp-tRNA(Asn)/Glu-tRNA(Gln) amidotransferase GatCAB subunit [Betaproteobacteria bacterium]|nr:Asp-tRNA(Asn)/Glu-tRNA(Gln) amidotransferase GatCAB subunit [Betaproteobacteria bacterium]